MRRPDIAPLALKLHAGKSAIFEETLLRGNSQRDKRAPTKAAISETGQKRSADVKVIADYNL